MWYGSHWYASHWYASWWFGPNADTQAASDYIVTIARRRGRR